jgi:hypothetical protein
MFFLLNVRHMLSISVSGSNPDVSGIFGFVVLPILVCISISEYHATKWALRYHDWFVICHCTSVLILIGLFHLLSPVQVSVPLCTLGSYWSYHISVAMPPPNKLAFLSRQLSDWTREVRNVHGIFLRTSPPVSTVSTYSTILALM